MSNYHVSQCTALINNPNVSNELKTLAEDLDRVKAIEQRLDKLSPPQGHE